MKWGHLKKKHPANCALGKEKKKPIAQRAILKSMKLSRAGWRFILMDNVCCAFLKSLEVFKEKAKITLFRRLTFLKEMSVFKVTLGLMVIKPELILNVCCWKITEVGGWERGTLKRLSPAPSPPGKSMFKLSKKPLQKYFIRIQILIICATLLSTECQWLSLALWHEVSHLLNPLPTHTCRRSVHFQLLYRQGNWG